MSLPRIFWTLDGKPIDFVWQSASAVLGGYDNCAGALPEIQARRRGAAQGSVLKAMQENGRPFYEGTLLLDPRYSNGLALISATGYKEAAELRDDRVPFQVRDLSIWGDATNPPFSQALAGTPATATIGPNLVNITYDNPTGSTKTYTAKIAAWFPGMVGGIARYAMNWAKSNVTSESVVVKLGMGPNGTLTTEATHTLSPVDRTVTTTGNDMMVIEISGQVATITNALFSIANLRLNGVGTTDTYTAGEVVNYLGALLGFDVTAVPASPTNVLPLDVTASWAGTWDYMAMIEDYQWRVLEDAGMGPRLEFGPWTKEWDVTLKSDATPDLAPLKRYNKVRVRYLDDVGADRSVYVTADPDPFALQKRTYLYTTDLRDIQGDTTLPTNVANTLISRLSSVRYAGRLQVVGARQDGGVGTVFDVLPGDLVTIADWGPQDAQTLRITEVEWTQYGATLGIEQPASAASLIAKALLPGHRRTVSPERLVREDVIDHRHRRRRHHRRRDGGMSGIGPGPAKLGGPPWPR